MPRTIELVVPDTVTTKAGVFKTDTWHADSIAHAFAYGAVQLINDSRAVSKFYRAKKDEPADDKGYLLKDGQKVARPAEEIEAEKAKGLAETIAAFESGDWGRTRGPSEPDMTPEEKELDTFLQETLEARAKATGQKLPTKSGKAANPELLAKLKADLYAKNKTAVDKIVRDRLKVKRAIEF